MQLGEMIFAGVEVFSINDACDTEAMIFKDHECWESIMLGARAESKYS